MNLLAESKGPDQTARMRRLIWTLAYPHNPEDTFLHGSVQISK